MWSVVPLLPDLEPVPELLTRVRAELAYAFVADRPIRLSRAPGRLDVMGGIADYTGSLVCEMTLDRAAAVALQRRDDRQVQVFSFNLLDEHVPFQLQISLDDLARASIDDLCHNINEPGRKWAGYMIGCLAILKDAKLIDLADPSLKGFNLAVLSTVPLGAGVSSSAAVEVATMMNLVDELGLREKLDPLRLAELCQRVENEVVGVPCGIMDQVSSCAGLQGTLMRMLCQPHEIKAPLSFPTGVRVVGINSCVRHNVGGGAYGHTRCAAFMGHRIILEEMRRFGKEAGQELIADPMGGYLANLDPDDYKRFFRHRLPESIKGSDFLNQYGLTIDGATHVEPDVAYRVQQATDHHVLESRRVREFTRYLTDASLLRPDTVERKLALDKAGHLMYASHKSYSDNALLGAPECDRLVALVRANEAGGLYGAKITGGGAGGTVAVLCNVGERADDTLRSLIDAYTAETGNTPDFFEQSSPGGWAYGTRVVGP